jgi:hypothetical protein
MMDVTEGVLGMFNDYAAANMLPEYDSTAIDGSYRFLTLYEHLTFYGVPIDESTVDIKCFLPVWVDILPASPQTCDNSIAAFTAPPTLSPTLASPAPTKAPTTKPAGKR